MRDSDTGMKTADIKVIDNSHFRFQLCQFRSFVFFKSMLDVPRFCELYKQICYGIFVDVLKRRVLRQD